MHRNSHLRRTFLTLSAVAIPALLIPGLCQSLDNAIPQDLAATQALAPPAPNFNVIQRKHYKLQHRSANHSTPDAIVLIAPGFDKTRPVHLIIYNHGLMDNLDEAVSIWSLDKRIKHAAPNTVMILPEWAENPEEYSSRAGRFHEPGRFRAMLEEIFSKTPELRSLKIGDLDDIAIHTYSGGFRATHTEIHKNGMESKIRSLSLFDSLYRSNMFDEWLSRHIGELASGRMQFHNFFFDTDEESLALLGRLKQMLAQNGIKNPSLVVDLKRPESVMDAQTIANHGIVFKFTKIYTDTHTAHQSAANVYFPKEVDALTLRRAIAAGQASPQM
jgi:hypothetical protein